jgi:hypothetical protein
MVLLYHHTRTRYELFNPIEIHRHAAKNNFTPDIEGGLPTTRTTPSSAACIENASYRDPDHRQSSSAGLTVIPRAFATASGKVFLGLKLVSIGALRPRDFPADRWYPDGISGVFLHPATRHHFGAGHRAYFSPADIHRPPEDIPGR